MDIAFNTVQINLQKGIKNLFDPNNILNSSEKCLIENKLITICVC